MGTARLLIVGNPAPEHVGAHLYRAAQEMGLVVRVEDVRRAYAGPWGVNKINWHLRGRYPTSLEDFSARVLETCREFSPDCVVATGIAPLTREALESMGEAGATRVNFLTDDPWNPAHRAPWFFRSLPCYDRIFSPRRANLEELRRLVPLTSYLPFAYAPEAHFHEEAISTEELSRYECDVMFAGTGDRDRLPYVRALVAAGVKVGLYGGRWGRFSQTRPHARGTLDLVSLRKAVSSAKVTLCLVRRANRDGHVMRTFELPSMESCVLAEDTADHRELFGEEGESALYFSTPDQMATKARWLLAHEGERGRLSRSAHQKVSRGRHTYRDRLEVMLGRTDE